MRLISIGISLTLTALLPADTLTLRNGRQIHGAYLGGSSREVKIDVGDQVQTITLDEIARIDFSAPAPAEETRSREQGNVFRPRLAETAPPARAFVELPDGTNLVVRMIDGVDSEVNRVGQTFAASLDEPVFVNGETVIPRGADVVVKLTDASQSGKLAGRSELTLDLVSVKVNGKRVDLNTETISRESSSRGKRTAKIAGGTAALGAIIGAIAGGGKGAAIGAGAGAATGLGVEVLTHGQRVKIPSETRLTFVLETPVRL
ncbi:MAG: hypothetical protein C5B51_08960 [Terriglobia bacterium]|nr:MAG: hypothetical protein C5B51_08960 [Terriglobia bacterium]